MQSPIQGIIFDMDGTMVDNMMVHHRAWQRKLEQLGLPMSLEQVKAEIHGINEEILERLFADKYSLDERRQIGNEKEAEYRRIFAEDLKLLPGLMEFLHDLHANQFPLAIGTAAPVENVYFVLERLNLSHIFTAILHAGSVQKGKPDPEIFQKAASGMGLDPDHCLVFEDSPTGVEAARRAGCRTIVVTTTHDASEFHKFPNVIKTIPNFEGLTVDWVRML